MHTLRQLIPPFFRCKSSKVQVSALALAPSNPSLIHVGAEHDPSTLCGKDGADPGGLALEPGTTSPQVYTIIPPILVAIDVPYFNPRLKFLTASSESLSVTRAEVSVRSRLIHHATVPGPGSGRHRSCPGPLAPSTSHIATDSVRVEVTEAPRLPSP